MKPRRAWLGLLALIIIAAPMGCRGYADPAILTQAVGKLQAAQSYRFTISAVHRWSFEGQEQEYSFSGSGAYSSDRFQSHMEGPVDTFFWVEIIGDTVQARDARGDVPGPPTTFGGPGPGTAPYTVIHYLINLGEVEGAGTATLSGIDAYHYRFWPQMTAITALDEAHMEAMKRVKKVEGEAWVDKKENIILQEKVKVDFLNPQGETESVTMTVSFSHFNEPVEF